MAVLLEYRLLLFVVTEATNVVLLELRLLLFVVWNDTETLPVPCVLVNTRQIVQCLCWRRYRVSHSRGNVQEMATTCVITM